MNEHDSFIDEVTEAVRRDKLYAALRRYGWIGILAVIVIVGGAAVYEYRQSSQRAAAEARGDAILAAMQLPEPQARLDALNQVPAEGDLSDVVALLESSERLAEDDPAMASEALRQVAQNTAIPRVYSDLAAFKMVLIGGDTLPVETRDQILQRLAQPGAPYRALALEQHAVDLAASGDSAAAIAAAQELLQEPGLTASLVQRVSQLLVALGADSPEGAPVNGSAPEDAG